MDAHRVLRRAALAATLLLPGLVRAQGAQDWLKRILDPATIGVAPFPGSSLNRKLSVDTIRYESDASKRIAVYLLPLDQTKAAAEHFQRTLGVEPTDPGPDPHGRPRWVFTVTGEGKQPAQAKGLVVKVAASPWVDGQGQIDMALTPPK